MIETANQLLAQPATATERAVRPGAMQPDAEPLPIAAAERRSSAWES